eukprot:6071977-Prymnesium_polylepis.1
MLRGVAFGEGPRDVGGAREFCELLVAGSGDGGARTESGAESSITSSSERWRPSQSARSGGVTNSAIAITRSAAEARGNATDVCVAGPAGSAFEAVPPLRRRRTGEREGPRWGERARRARGDEE